MLLHIDSPGDGRSTGGMVAGVTSDSARVSECSGAVVESKHKMLSSFPKFPTYFTVTRVFWRLEWISIYYDHGIIFDYEAITGLSVNFIGGG